MKIGLFFSAIASLFAISAFTHGGGFWLLLWPAFSFAFVASGYFGLGPRVYGKSSKENSEVEITPYSG